VERRWLQRELVDAVWEEQRRFGQEIHDGPCQAATAANLFAVSLHSDLEARSAPEKDLAAKVLKLTGHLSTQLRGLARELYPSEVAANALPEALEELANHTETVHEIGCTVVCDDDVVLVDGQTATHLRRIAQEAVNNAVKHSGAKQISIRLLQDRGVVLEIRDDGVGFDAQQPGRRKGLGTSIMRSRAEAIRATLDIRSRPGEGTTVVCRC
jgi:signal transduction histidine kinase